MRSALIAGGVLLALIIGVIMNSFFIIGVTEELIEEIEGIGDVDAVEKLVTVREKFDGIRWIITLSVSHDDILNIEEAFAEAIGAARGADTAELQIAKSRLTDALVHLGRLSGINADSIL